LNLRKQTSSIKNKIGGKIMKTKKRLNLITMVLGVMALTIAMGSSAFAIPVVDGKFTDGDYDKVYNISLLDKSGKIDGKSRIGTKVVGGDLYVAFEMSTGINDNSYGKNSIGWGKKEHKFKNLVGSDEAGFRIGTGGGSALTFDMDYISETGIGRSGYSTEGVDKAEWMKREIKKGKVEWKKDKSKGKLEAKKGDFDGWEFGSSLGYNLNDLTYPAGKTWSDFLDDSPATSPSDTYNNPEVPGWIFNLVYELKIPADVFGPGGVQNPFVWITDMHNSPAKLKGPTVPEPASMLLLGSGLVGLAGFRRRLKKK
jgi:hypothetical protein